jgi:hypothetical protein
MKPFITIILSFLLPFQILMAQTKNQIVNLKIYCTNQISTWKAKPRIYRVFYDEKANITKEIEILGKTNTKTITTYKYLDTLLIQSIEQFFEKDKLVSTLTTTYTYQFEGNRIKSKTITSSLGNIAIEKYTYNRNNQFDTVFIYNNDTTIWTSQQPILGEEKLNKTASIKKIKLYSYLDSNRVSVLECNYPSFEYYSCKTHETIESDTLDISIEKYWTKQGDIMNSAQTVEFTKVHKKNGLVYFQESNVFFNSKTYYEYKRNSLGLVSRTKATTLTNGKKSIYMTNYKYYFRP